MGLMLIMVCDGCKVQVPPEEKTYTVNMKHNAERREPRDESITQTNFSLCEACAGVRFGGTLADLHARFLKR